MLRVLAQFPDPRVVRCGADVDCSIPTSWLVNSFFLVLFETYGHENSQSNRRIVSQDPTAPGYPMTDIDAAMARGELAISTTRCEVVVDNKNRKNSHPHDQSFVGFWH